MDGFDVRRFCSVDEIYSVDTMMARYLVAAEYAVCVDAELPNAAEPHARKCHGCGSRLTLPEKAAGFPIPSLADYVCVSCQRAYRWHSDVSEMRLIDFD